MYQPPGNNGVNDKLPTSTGEFAGFLNEPSTVSPAQTLDLTHLQANLDVPYEKKNSFPLYLLVL